MPDHDDSANKPIFAIPRTDYGSYADLYRLIDLSGYPRIFVDQVDAESDHTYILTCNNGEIAAGWPNAKARIILHDFEWRDRRPADIPGVARYWHMDKAQAERIGYQYVPIGSHPDLAQGPAAFPRYDVAYIGYMPPRREQIASDLRWKMGAKAFISNHLWGDERDEVLRQSRAYLHVHQLDRSPGVPGLRMVVAAAYGLAVMSETVADAGIFDPSMLMQADYAHLVEFVALWTRDTEGHKRLADIGARLRYELCERLTFRKSVEAAL